MIASLSGIVKAIHHSTIVIEVGGVGLLVQVPPRISSSLHIGRSASLHTSLLVREDALTLYGFESVEDRALFELLQTVTGIGPKVAQSALNIYESPELAGIIQRGELSPLEKIPGLGKKGAQRVVLELKEKVVGGVGSKSSVTDLWRDQLNEALLGLGFNAKDSLEAIDGVQDQFADASTEPIDLLLKAALQLRGRRP